MVYPGPWQESRIHEEIFTLKDSSATDRTVELLGDAPTVRSGWDANHLSELGWTVLEGASGTYEQGFDNPPEAKSELSEEAFAGMLGKDVGATGVGTIQYRMHQTGDQLNLTPPPRWIQTQQWEARGAGYRLWYDRDLEDGNTGSTMYAVPPGVDDTDDYYLELETLGAYKPVELVDVTVLASPPTSDYRLFVKDAHPTAAEPFLRSAVAQGGAPSSIVEARAFPAADGDLPLDHTVLNALAKDGTPASGAEWSGDGRMPTLAVLYDGPTLSVATLNGDVGYDQTHQGQPVRIRIRYRWPRWRKVYYDRPPYRRITQRGDGLAGGARRIHPRPKTIQGSNRRGAGSVV